MMKIEESDGTVIFSLERVLVAGTKLTWVHANNVGKPGCWHVYDARKERVSNADSVRLKMHALQALWKALDLAENLIQS
jgi:hypothetical protein